MDNEIADIIQDFEGWIETLNDNPYEGAGRDFADFVNLDVIIETLKKVSA